MTKEKRIPPEDIIREDSGPTTTKVPKPKPGDLSVDVDDAQLEEPKEDVFEQPSKGKS